MCFAVGRTSLLLSLALAAAWLAAAPEPARAQAASSSESPAEESLAVEPVQSRADLALAYASLAGPRTEIVAGSLFVAGSPLLGAFAMVLVGPPLFCGVADGETQQSCDEQRQRGRTAGVTVGLVTGLIGVGLLGHGAYRVRQIRVARRAQLVPSARLDLQRERAGLLLDWRF